jgi:hypothetical protein
MPKAKITQVKYTKNDSRGRPPEVPVLLTNTRSNATRQFACAGAAARFLKGSYNRDNVRNAARNSRVITGTNYVATFK